MSKWTQTLCCSAIVFAGLVLSPVTSMGQSSSSNSNGKAQKQNEAAPIPQPQRGDKPGRGPKKRMSERRSLNSFSQSFPEEYRTIDGVGNNETNTLWGASHVPFLRKTTVAYLDGLDEPSGDLRPSAREISNAVAAQNDLIFNKRHASDFIWQWGQFLDHDIDETPAADPNESLDILVPSGDPYFDPASNGDKYISMNRSAYEKDSVGVRQQINAITAYIDASNVYGADDDRAEALRTMDGTGKLKTSEKGLLPYNVDNLPNAALPFQNAEDMFLAGDVRANEQVGLISMHTLFVREHNHWAEAIARKDPNLEGDDIYEMARIIVAAEMQAITYREFLPVLLGNHPLDPYRGYKPNVDAGIANVFATAAYRVGHTMLSEELLRLERNGRPVSDGNLALANAFFNPQEVEDYGIEPYLRGLATQPAQEIDTHIIDAVRNFLFGPPGSGGFDLASLNLQRGRDHGLPSYNQVRLDYGLSSIDSFDVYPANERGLQQKLEELYGTPDNMDPWIGMLGERHVRDGMVGETLHAILKDQFQRLRDGDRFWYQHYLSPELQKLVEQQTLSKIIQRNTRIGSEIQDDVFRASKPGKSGRPEEKEERGNGKGRDRDDDRRGPPPPRRR